MANEQENKSETIDLRELLAQYISKWWLFAICIVICMAAGWLFTKNKPQNYLVEANILINQDEEKNSNGIGVRAAFGNLANMFGSNGNVDDEVYLVGSHTVLRNAIKELNIHKLHYLNPYPLINRFVYQEYPLDVYAANPNMADTLMTTLLFKVKVNADGEIRAKVYHDRHKIATAEGTRFPLRVNTPYGEFYVNKTDFFVPGKKVKSNIYFSGYNPAAEMLAEEVTIGQAGKKTNVISLSVQSTSTDYAKDLLNEIIAQYNTRSVEDRREKSRRTHDFIQERLALLSDSLRYFENSLRDFRQSEGITNLEAEITYNLTRKGETEVALVEADAQAEIFKMLIQFANDPQNKYALMPATAATPEASEAISSYNTLVLKRMDLARNARANSIPLRNLDEQIDAMHSSLVSTLNKGYESSLLSAREMHRAINAADMTLGRIPEQDRVHRQILRQQHLKEELYIFLMQRLEESAMTLSNDMGKGQIVDEAFSHAKPLGLKPMMVLILAFFFGLILAPILLYLAKLTRNKFTSKDELEHLTQIPILGEVCTARSGETLVVKPGGSTSIAELFRLIRTNLQFVLNNSNDKVVLMTSTRSGEGKSFVSINLAASLALLGKRVVLVGMDIRAPKLNEYLELPPSTGLTEYLSSDSIDVDDIILRDPLGDGLDIIVSGPVPPNPSELLLSPRVEVLFDTLRQMYDYIIVDSAPVGMVSDTFSLARISDATIYVCRANYTTLRDVRFFNDEAKEGRLKKLSLVINGTTAKQGYGYGYGDNASGKKHRKKQR